MVLEPVKSDDLGPAGTLTGAIANVGARHPAPIVGRSRKATHGPRRR